jgi:carboxypeptidase Q
MRISRMLAAIVVVAGAQMPGRADERIDYEMNVRIRQEGRQSSQIMRTMHYLTDVYGPRLTGSPNHKAAAEWAIEQMREWGMTNAHIEPWDFGHPGWLNERFSAHIVSPVKDALVGEVLAWTPGTNGTLTARAVHIAPPQCPAPAATRGPFGPAAPAAPAAEAPADDQAREQPGRPQCPTQEELTKYFDNVKSQVKGRIVLVGAHRKVPVTFTPSPLRRDDDVLRQQYDPANPAAAQPFARREQPRPPPGRLTANQIDEEIDRFLLANGALARVNDAGRDHGQIRAFNNRTFDVAKAPPTVILRNEDYGRITRLLAGGLSVGPRSPGLPPSREASADRRSLGGGGQSRDVELEFTITNRSYPEGRTSYNAIAEIPGTDKKNEVVMLGGHLDSWHAATGATDNAIGCAVMMEAARILAALGVKPRRTIRVALWSGEEQGLLGSKAYVKEHFGTFENPKPEFETFTGYFNVDSGTGRIRGASIFGPAEAATVLREAFAPFEDLGVVGAVATRSRRSGGTDSTSFNEAGLPGIGLGQDPIQYQSHTWHTNLDTYERIVEEDVKKSAIAIAAAVYHVAMREEKLPRFSKADMPAPPATRPAATSTAGAPQ